LAATWSAANSSKRTGLFVLSVKPTLAFSTQMARALRPSAITLPLDADWAARIRSNTRAVLYHRRPGWGQRIMKAKAENKG